MKKIVVEIPHYQLTATIALLLLLYVITFLTGYFWGKKSALEEFADQIKNESFSDKVYASLCSLYDQPSENSENNELARTEDANESTRAAAPQEQQQSFVAQLIGYGTEKQALAYVKTLERKGIAARVFPRTSISAHGKKRVWYQVVTAPADYQTIQNLVKRLSIEDRLAGVSIVETGLLE
jgi:hypothetical protein